jgi:hypothetical protein
VIIQNRDVVWRRLGLPEHWQIQIKCTEKLLVAQSRSDARIREPPYRTSTVPVQAPRRMPSLFIPS